MRLLAIDPGGTTGFAVFTGESLTNSWRKGRIGCRENAEEIDDIVIQLCEESTDLIIVIEKFQLFPWKSKSLAWSQLNTVQIIGRVKALARLYQITVKEQTTGNRDIGYMWGKVPKLPKSNPSNHAHDAWAHAAFYIIDNGGVIDG